jgi:hypothetical protein
VARRIAILPALALLALLILGLVALATQAKDPGRVCAPGMMQSSVGEHVICWLPT